MTDDLPPRGARALWQNQTAEPARFSLEEIRRKAHRFQRAIRWRNAREYIAALVVVGVFGWFAWSAETTVSRIGHGLVIAGTLYVVRRLRTTGAAQPLPVDMAAASCVTFYRQEIERQRHLLQSVWRWYLGPLLPGLLIVFAERAVEATTKGPEQLLRVAIFAVICALVFLGVGRLNKAVGRRLEAEIRALDSSEG